MGEARVDLFGEGGKSLGGWATDDDGTHHTIFGLTFHRLREINVRRKDRWHPTEKSKTDWTGADWANAMAGEMGEACNVVKKLRRIETGAATKPGEQDETALREKLGEEIADVIIYADLLAHYYKIQLPIAIVDKFNKKSEEFGFPERLP